MPITFGAGVRLGGGISVIPGSSTWNNINGSTYLTQYSLSPVPQPLAWYFKPDGLKLYILSFNGAIYQWSLGTPWTLSTLSYDSVTYTPSQTVSTSRTFTMSSDGTKLYVGPFAGPIYQYTLATPWSLSSVSYASKSFTLSADTTQLGISLTPNGTTLYVVGNATDSVYQLTLSTPNDISTCGSQTSVSVASQDTTPNGVYIKPDGTRMYVTGSLNDAVYQYTLSTPGAVASASYGSINKSVAAQSANPQAVQFNQDGTRMWVLCSATPIAILEYSN